MVLAAVARYTGQAYFLRQYMGKERWSRERLSRAMPQVGGPLTYTSKHVEDPCIHL